MDSAGVAPSATPAEPMWRRETGMPDLPRVSVAGGSVASEQLGRTLLHEHLVVTSPEVWASWTALLGSRAALVDRAAAELAAIKSEHGIDTIVDVSTPDMG